jgi:serine/threonine protein kinase
MDKVSSQTDKKCSECDNPKGKFGLCTTCTSRHIQAEIDEFIEYTQTLAHEIRWANWEEFTNIKKIGEGGFGSVYSSHWSKSIETVALKTIGNPSKLMSNFLKEVISIYLLYSILT